MARKKEAEQHLRQGLYPYQIAGEMGVSVNTVIQYLQTRVGEGALRLSDIYLSWPADKRKVLRQQGPAYFDVRLLRAHGLSREEAMLFNSLDSRRVLDGDMYVYLSDIEMKVHKLVRDTLAKTLGPNEDGWWRQGIPQPIRTKCTSRREEDEEYVAEPFGYTTLIELSIIIQKNWVRFEDVLPGEYTGKKTTLEKDFARLNRIRNSVMHPVKGRKWTDDDFLFVRRMHKLFQACPRQV